MASPRTVEVLVEIPRGSRNKYQYDHRRHVFVLDRVLHGAVHYPADYGFIPGTLAEDGDPLDALVVVWDSTFPGCLVPARPIGMLRMRDEKGEDHKVLAVPEGDPRFDSVRDLGDLPRHWLLEIENFFETYKTLEGVEAQVLGWIGRDEAWHEIREAQQRAHAAAERAAEEVPGHA